MYHTCSKLLRYSPPVPCPRPPTDFAQLQELPTGADTFCRAFNNLLSACHHSFIPFCTSQSVLPLPSRDLSTTTVMTKKPDLILFIVPGNERCWVRQTWFDASTVPGCRARPSDKPIMKNLWETANYDTWMERGWDMSPHAAAHQWKFPLCCMLPSRLQQQKIENSSKDICPHCMAMMWQRYCNGMLPLHDLLISRSTATEHVAS